MVNLDMENTIFDAVSSVASQLDSRFEIVILDGGSKDKSKEKIIELSNKFDNISYIFMERNPKRKLGLDRDICIKNSRGEYLILNIDCDDIYENHITDWVFCYHKIEEATKIRGVYVSGAQINMVGRDIYNEIGGYRNSRYEDRDIWMRAAACKKFVIWSHHVFRNRMELNRKQKIKKNIFNSYDGVLYDYEHNLTLIKAFHFSAREFFPFSPNKLIKIFFIPMVHILGWFGFYQKIKDIKFTPETFSNYKRENATSFENITAIKSHDLAPLLKNSRFIGYLY